jgi:two-component system response regulator VicR/two-component system response regulator RegX3
MPHILLVEDYEPVRQSMKETLELEGWRVKTCADGSLALRVIKSETHFDLLILDNELPSVSGMELIRRARDLEHRKQTPIIMISASEWAMDARLAGANEFLRKPQDVGKIVEVVMRLLA